MRQKYMWLRIVILVTAPCTVLIGLTAPCSALWADTSRVYVCVCFLPQYGTEDEVPSVLPVFHWIPMENMTQLEHCRNSRQGHTLIVDELGKMATHILFVHDVDILVVKT